MMQILDRESFFSRCHGQMFYAGFLKSTDTWFPLCLVSRPEEGPKLDTLFLACSDQVMDGTLQRYARNIPQVQHTFVHQVAMEEVGNLLETYGLDCVALIYEDGDEQGCSCGCDCR